MLEILDQLYEQLPIESLAASFSSSLFVCLTAGRLAMPRSFRTEFKPGRKPARFWADQALRTLVIAIIFKLFWVISWRPVYSCLGTISFFAIFAGISRAKYIFIREPLVFSDIALVRDVLKYKDIFYATWANSVFWLFAVLYVFGVSGLFFAFEPTVLPEQGWVSLVAAGLLLLIGLIGLLLWRPVRKRVSRVVASWVGELHLRRNSLRFGTFEYVALSFLIWFGKIRETFVDELIHEVQSILHDRAEGAPLLVVWQSESFIDMRRFGVKKLKLPHLDDIRARAVCFGLLGNVFEGGYTLRTEFAVLSGLKPDEVGLDFSYPYLRARNYRSKAWPVQLQDAGWHTQFIHPYDRTFFMRHRAIPELGFTEMTMLDAFDHKPTPERPYVSDAKLAVRTVEAVRSARSDTPTMLFVASMGNHGPWQKGRAGYTGNSLSIYCDLLREADAALGELVEELDQLDRPVWLVFYGDHAPLLKSFADPFPDPRTDYAMVPLGRAERKDAKAHRKDVQPWDLLDELAEAAGLRRMIGPVTPEGAVS